MRYPHHVSEHRIQRCGSMSRFMKDFCLQGQVSLFSHHHFPLPHPSPPPPSVLPRFGFVRGSLIHVPWWTFPFCERFLLKHLMSVLESKVRIDFTFSTHLMKHNLFVPQQWRRLGVARPLEELRCWAVTMKWIPVKRHLDDLKINVLVYRATRRQPGSVSWRRWGKRVTISVVCIVYWVWDKQQFSVEMQNCIYVCVKLT